MASATKVKEVQNPTEGAGIIKTIDAGIMCTWTITAVKEWTKMFDATGTEMTPEIGASIAGNIVIGAEAVTVVGVRLAKKPPAGVGSTATK